MRYLSCLMCCACILLTACGEKRTPFPIWDGFICDLAISYGDEEYTARLDRREPSKTVVTMVSPSDVTGLVMTRCGEKITVSMQDEGYEIAVADCPKTALLYVLTEIMDNDAPHRQAANGIVQGEIHETAYTIRFDEANGGLSEMAIPSLPLSVRFGTAEYPRNC